MPGAFNTRAPKRRRQGLGAQSTAAPKRKKKSAVRVRRSPVGPDVKMKTRQQVSAGLGKKGPKTTTRTDTRPSRRSPGARGQPKSGTTVKDKVRTHDLKVKARQDSRGRDGNKDMARAHQMRDTQSGAKWLTHNLKATPGAAKTAAPRRKGTHLPGRPPSTATSPKHIRTGSLCGYA